MGGEGGCFLDHKEGIGESYDRRGVTDSEFFDVGMEAEAFQTQNTKRD